MRERALGAMVGILDPESGNDESNRNHHGAIIDLCAIPAAQPVLHLVMVGAILGICAKHMAQ